MNLFKQEERDKESSNNKDVHIEVRKEKFYEKLIKFFKKMFYLK